MSANARTPGVETFLAYDTLPPRLRKALAEFPEDMSSEFALSQLRAGVSEEALLAKLEEVKAKMRSP